MSIRVLVAEDADAYRDTLVALLGLEDDMKVVAELSSGERIVSVALELCPDVALLDIDLPGVDGLTAAAELVRRLPACRVLMLTGVTVRDGRRRALAAGASGLFFKDGSADDLVDAVRRVARGGRVFDVRPR
jgi:DNA-binding NarL/FixJ family response regulator